jgi:hypothetical protein
MDTDKRRVLSSVAVGQSPFAVALSPDRRRLWVTDGGSADTAGACVSVIDVENAAQPRVVKSVRIAAGAASPSGVTVTADRAYISHAGLDIIAVINSTTLEMEREIPLRIPGLESYRGIMPAGSLFNETTGWLLVAEAGINAVGVIDTRRMELIGHIPAAWFPTRLVQHEDLIFVACAKGYGTGPNATRRGFEVGEFFGERRRGAMVAFPIPDPDELAPLTLAVLTNNGFVKRDQAAPALPPAIEHVVLIVKEGRTYDEIMGDIVRAANGTVNGIPVLARFGMSGIVNHRRGELQTRLGLRYVKVTPNHHGIAQRFSFGDNFYADSEGSADGHRWLFDSYPDVLSELRLMLAGSKAQPSAPLGGGAFWRHLEKHDVPFRVFTDTLGTSIPDQTRASKFIREIEEAYSKTGKDLPRMLLLSLPNDFMARVRPEAGYPFEGSYVADNDYALGRVVEYLSRSKWWPKMAIFVTESSADGPDHIDSHRTVLLVASPYARRSHATHVNTSFPGLRKTILRLLRLPPMSLYDAAAADLAGCFTAEPDLEPYKALPVPKELFDPETATGSESAR